MFLLDLLPWWFNDVRKMIAAVINELHGRGGLACWVGMLSDGRSLPAVVARMKLFRAVLAVSLAELMPGREPEYLVEHYAKPICFQNGAAFLGVTPA